VHASPSGWQQFVWQTSLQFALQQSLFVKQAAPAGLQLGAQSPLVFRRRGPIVPDPALPSPEMPTPVTRNQNIVPASGSSTIVGPVVVGRYVPSLHESSDWFTTQGKPAPSPRYRL
jgi:hypothetical protein